MVAPPNVDLSHPRVNVLGVGISAINMKRAVELADRHIAEGRPGYVCVSPVHAVMEAQTDPAFRSILNSATITTPDGMPLSWIGRFQGFRDMDRVYGPDFMLEMCRLSVQRGYRHFLYGGKPGIAERLKESLTERFPGLEVSGTFTPPFRPLTAGEEVELEATVAAARPHLFWVGLSTPKQERFMAKYVRRLNVPLMVGVGAAFDFHTGNLKEAPRWMKRSGMQWLHRFMQEPRRLGPRYLATNPRFVFQIALQLSGLRPPPMLSNPER
jgi:N-acetylglucosaminyldiphosphoundecaprenol N-acetyl-beta-D-mannosaminyltransferase